MPKTLKQTYSRKEVLEIIRYIQRQTIEVTLYFPERRLNIYSGSWKFKYPEDILKQLEKND